MTKQNLEKHYDDKFGKVDYEKLKELREWLYQNEQKDSMIAYLFDENPYKL